MRRFRCSRNRRGGVAFVAGTLAAALCGAPAPGSAQEPGASPRSIPDWLAEELDVANDECCRPLLFPIGARRASMSAAVTAVASPDAVFYNPAGLAELDGSHFVLHHIASDIQPVDAFTLLVSPGNLAVFGVSYALVDYGEQEFTGDDQTPIGRVGASDHILIASFATTVFTGVSAGLNYKYFNWRIDCSGQCGGTQDLSAVTHGLDFGVQYEPLWLAPLRIGAALLNVGFPLQVINSEQADPMPTRLRVGVSYDVMQHLDPVGPYRLLVLVDAEDEDWKQPTSPTASVALEMSAGDIVFLRAGYGGGEGLSSGPAVGVGVVYSSFNIAVAKRVSSGGLGDAPFQLSVDVGF